MTNLAPHSESGGTSEDSASVILAPGLPASAGPRSPVMYSARPRPQLQARHLKIGCFVFYRQDQIDFTGPFEVLSRIPDSTVYVIGKKAGPVHDVKGLILTAEMAIEDAPDLDVLVVSGGLGQQALMEDSEVLSFIDRQMKTGRLVFSICTGALLCGAAGILQGRLATSHWAAWSLLPYYGATPVRARVVVDGNLVSCAGVTAGIDGALVVASLLRGEAAAKEIQLDIEYSPDPVFHSGTPETASEETIRDFYREYGSVKESREGEARRFARKLGVAPNESVTL